MYQGRMHRSENSDALGLASSPQAQVIVSSVLPSKSVSPPYPFHRAMGSKNSIPASSAICASFKFVFPGSVPSFRNLGDSHAARAIGEKMPSLSLFPLNIGGFADFPSDRT